MRVGCGLRVRRIDGNEYMYFWHYEREAGRSARRRAHVRRRQDLARPRRRDLRWRRPGAPPLRTVSRHLSLVELVPRIDGPRSPRGLCGPRLRRAPRRPRGRLRQEADASAPRREGVRARPIRFRPRRAPPEPRGALVVPPAILLRRRAPRPPRHHRYYARAASGRELDRLSDREEA